MYVKVGHPADEIPNASTSQADRNSTRKPANDGISEIPSVIFAFPFPEPKTESHSNQESPAFLIYTFPRSIYEKPGADPLTGEKKKEKLVKKLERKWQEEVKEARDLKKGLRKDAGWWKKSKGAVIRSAASTIQWMPNNVIEVLARLPPDRKLGQVSVIHPELADLPPWFKAKRLSEAQMENLFVTRVAKIGNEAKIRSILSGCLLPITLAIDILVLVPIFVFEINLAYFMMQMNGSKKAISFANAKKKSMAVSGANAEAESSMFHFEAAQERYFDRTIQHLYSICSSIDPIKFPLIAELPPLNYVPDANIAAGLIEIFIDSLPPNVSARHTLDIEEIAVDLDRSLRKAAKEYIKTLN